MSSCVASCYVRVCRRRRAPAFCDRYDRRKGEDAGLKRAVWNLQRAGLLWLRSALSEPLAEQRRQPVAVTAAQFQLRAVVEHDRAFAVRLRLQFADAFKVDDG